MLDGAWETIEALTTDFTEFDENDTPQDTDGPLDWPGYALSRKSAAERSGTTESVVCGRGTVGGVETVLVVFDFRFLGGSVGVETGTRIVRAFTEARMSGLPVVSLLATGGTRVQEGILSLQQLQRIARAAAFLRRPHVAVLRDPTTGGMWASLAAGADVVLAMSGAQIAFAGSRVRPSDDFAYTAEGQFAAGHVDEIVSASTLPQRLAAWLRLLVAGSTEPAEVPRALGTLVPAQHGWQAVQRARASTRPRAEAYLADYFDSRLDIRGDHADGVVCGVGVRKGRSVAYAAQIGTATSPAGFRTAARLIRLADRIGLPVLTLVDTPGAAADPAAERAGVGPAIAELFTTIATAQTPITTLVIGEGGSGGALALCAPQRTWITPDAYFSVIAPELAAAILKHDPADVATLAGQLKLSPLDLLALGAVRGIAR